MRLYILFLFVLNSFAAAFCTLTPLHVIDIYAPQSANIQEIESKDFKAGEQLLVFDTSLAESEVKMAKLELQQAEHALNRAKKSSAAKAVIEDLSLEVKKKEIQLKQARLRLGAFKINAPFDGTLVALKSPSQLALPGSLVAQFKSRTQLCVFYATEQRKNVLASAGDSKKLKPKWRSEREPVSQKYIGELELDWPEGLRVKVEL